MGMPIVILHGWGKRLDRWQSLKRELERAGWRVFLPILPGFGSAPAPAKVWAVSDYAQWVKERLPHNYFLLGYSFGGRIAIKIATQNPVGLKGLILVGSAGIRAKKSLKRAIFWLGAKIGKIIFFLPPLNFFKGLARRVFYQLAGERDYYQAKGVMRETLKRVVNEDLQKEMKKIKIPTLLLWGGKDKLTPLTDGHLMSSLIEKASLKVVPNAGHDLPLKLPRLTAKEVIKFCQQYR